MLLQAQLICLLSLPLLAQNNFLAVAVAPPGTTQGLRLSISPQGTEALRALVGRVIPATQAISLLVCTDGPAVSVQGGRIYERLSSLRIAWNDSQIAGAIASRSFNRNWAQVTLTILRYGLPIAGIVMSSGLVSVSATVEKAVVPGVIGANSIAGQIQSALTGQLPSITVLTGNILQPETSLAVPANGCAKATVVGPFDRKHQVPTETVAFEPTR